MPALSNLLDPPAPNATERVYAALHQAIITLHLPPGAKVSEAELAKQLGVSRQPVRDAFYRLSELGFLTIRPQRPTVITHISPHAVQDARFNRTALEVACLREAVKKATQADIATLDQLIADQATALAKPDELAFHALDDAFHRAIAQIAGHPSAWGIIQGQKVHLDRVRYLSVISRGKSAINEHRAIIDAMKAKDSTAAESAMHTHLWSIMAVMAEVQTAHPDYFVKDADAVPKTD